jgi:polyvinyl alcohol dehydrogenase (cytochrome)
VDAKRGLVYVTTGDNYSDPGTPLSDAVVALRLDTGAIAWARQVLPNDRWNAACLGDKVNCPDDAGPDADFGSPAILARAPSGRELLIAAQKSGIVWALDPDRRGRVVWNTAVGKGGPLGGIQWGHATDASRVYAPISDVQLADMANTGGGIAALNLEDGSLAWKAPPASCGERTPCSPAQMAGAAVVPGAVISGARDGVYRAYAAEDGRVIWSFDTWRDFETVNQVAARGGSIDGPAPLVVGRMLYLNSGYSLWNGRGGNVLLALEAN